MSAESDRIGEGVGGAGKGAILGALVGVFGCAGTHAVFELWPALLGIPGAVIGFLWGYFEEKRSQNRPRTYDSPGSVPNPHPMHSSLWYSTSS